MKPWHIFTGLAILNAIVATLYGFSFMFSDVTIRGAYFALSSTVQWFGFMCLAAICQDDR